MKKLLITVGLLAAAVGIFYFQQKRQPSDAKDEVGVKEQASLTGPKGEGKEKPWFASKARRADAVEADAETNHVMDLKGFKKLLDEANLESSLHLTATVQKLRAQNDDQVASFFLEELHSLGMTNSNGRGRLVFLANALQSPKLLPFWEDLALRLTPAHANEGAIVKAEEPSISSMAVNMEMTMAIRNIGLIALGNHRAADVLLQVINDPNPEVHDAFIRERAFIALKESDLTASLRVLKMLKEEDPLLARIRSAQAQAQ